MLEHIREPEKALLEIRRVLKPGGFHIFTIPYHEGKKTLQRVTFDDREEIRKFPPVYHGDPLRKHGALVFTDSGADMNVMPEKTGYLSEGIPYGIWYTPREIPYITDEKEYEAYHK